SLSRYSKSTVRRHRRVSHFEVEFAKLVRGDDDTPNGVISCLLLVNQIAVFFQTATDHRSRSVLPEIT
ncbi:hypothetical protein, partial [Aeromonas dhakensis]